VTAEGRYFAGAAHGGDFEALNAVLDPEVLLRVDRHPATTGIRGAAAVASHALAFSRLVQRIETVLVNGAPGIISYLPNGRHMSMFGQEIQIADARYH